MSAATLNAVSSQWRQSRSGRRIGLSDFSHGRKWRVELDEAGFMEIVDRGDTVGWLISDDSLGELVQRIDALELELERAHVSAILAARAERDEWAEGPELANAAKASFSSRADLIEEVVDGD